MKRLHSALKQAIADVQSVTIVVAGSEAKLRDMYRSNLSLQLESLRQMEREMRSGTLSRRNWSLGLATVPVITSLLKAIKTSPEGVEREALERCQASAKALYSELIVYAEGR